MPTLWADNPCSPTPRLVIKHGAEIRNSQVCLRTLLPKATILTYVIKVVAAKALKLHALLSDQIT